MSRFLAFSCASVCAILTAQAFASASAAAAPTADVAKRCLHYAYIVYPYKPPGAVQMSGDRQAYFRDCIAKNGDVPVPIAAKP